MGTNDEIRMWTQGYRLSNKTLIMGLGAVVIMSVLAAYSIYLGISQLGAGDLWGLGYISAGILIFGIFAWSFMVNVKSDKNAKTSN